MYKTAFILYTSHVVTSMYISLNVDVDFEITSLSDLPKFKQIMEYMKMKINKSNLAKELGLDRKTVDKYLNGFVPKKTRKKASKIDDTMK